MLLTAPVAVLGVVAASPSGGNLVRCGRVAEAHVQAVRG